MFLSAKTRISYQDEIFMAKEKSSFFPVGYPRLRYVA